VFHRQVGFDHIYLYDNTQYSTVVSNDNDEATVNETVAYPLKQVTDLFSPDFVTWIQWPAKVCNNNFIGGRWPGERSSQYTAEASCRERFGPYTEWMSFFDIDEYLVPLQNDTWKPLLDHKARANNPVLALRESRALPRWEMMEQVTNKSICRQQDETSRSGGTDTTTTTTTTCLVPRRNVTFLSLYNCDTVKAPRPREYFRNMKQIYQPDFVLSHFVHYSAVTRPMAEYYRDKTDPSSFHRIPSAKEKYVLNEME
jgi:hypothetical protein